MPNLTHINSFNNLTKIHKLSIYDMPKLSTISGFNKLDIAELILIETSPNLKTITGFSNLTEIGKAIIILDNKNLTHITGFNNLTKIKFSCSLQYNPELRYISGFNNLTEIGGDIYLNNNPKLISMSIPYTLIKSVDYVERGIYYGGGVGFNSPQKFINYPKIIKEFIHKFNPVIYPDIVVKQTIENLDLWGEPDTIKTIINHILSKGDYWYLIPEKFYQYVEDHHHHLYNAKYANTGARGIAKMNTGRYLGMF